MRALLRPLFVGALSVAIGATGLLGSTSVALAATGPRITTWSVTAPVYEGDRPFANATFTDPDLTDQHTVEIDWGDGTTPDTYRLTVGDRSFSLQKTVPYVSDSSGAALTVTITLSDGIFATTRFVGVTVLNAAPSISSFALSSASVEAGKAVTATGTFADNGAADTHTVTVAWGDGATSDSGTLASTVTTFEASHVYADTIAYSVVVTLADSASHTVTASASVSPTNVAPVVGTLSLSPTSVVDHQTLTVGGTFTDPGTADTFTLTMDWGDGTSSSQSLAAGRGWFSDSRAYHAAGPVTI